jgi:bifunctional UDP-N-acetylglucosamine pyrophosphorylase/glucosamine-1-phosphate N-acetyltransferase
MQTLILAAGQGTRMRPLTEQRPKPMLPVAGQPLVAHTATAAIDAGASRLVLVVGYEGDAVRSFFGREFKGVPVDYAVQDQQRGTADAVRAGAAKLDNKPFAVLNGDNLYDSEALTELFDRGPSVGSYQVASPSAYGVLDIKDGQVTSVVEKPDTPPSNVINTGAYVFPAAAQDWLDVESSERDELEVTDVLNRACEETAVTAVPLNRWLDVGRPWELLEANEWKLEEYRRQINGEVHADAELRGPVIIESGATVEAGVVIEGPALLQAGATVGPNAYVRGATLLGPETTVGHSVEVKNSVLMEGATVGHLSYVGDSILGRDVNFGAGTTVANLRHDEAPITCPVKGELVSTGRRKFGVVCGDGVKTGINTSLNAGVVLPGGATTAPNETILKSAATRR